jgi:hypothetical protein
MGIETADGSEKRSLLGHARFLSLRANVVSRSNYPKP